MNCKGCLLFSVALLLVGLLALGVFTITAGHFLTAVDAFSQADVLEQTSRRAGEQESVHPGALAPYW